MDTRKRFVIGFPIDMEQLLVALITKKRGPAFMIGQLNGGGGGVDLGESPVGAIRREMMEEMGLDLPGPGQWQQFHYERRDNGIELWFYTASVPGLTDLVYTKTDEQVSILSIPQIVIDLGSNYYLSAEDDGDYGIKTLGEKGSRFVYNLGYLIPMAYSWLKNPQHQYVER